MQIADIELRFHKLLNSLAVQAREELTKHQIEFYDKALQAYGYEKVVVALEEILKDQRPGQHMPSIAEIERHINKADEVSIKAEAMQVMALLNKYISYRGSSWEETFKYDGYTSFEKAFLDKCGPVAWEVVKAFGGWSTFVGSACEASSPETFRAQVRDMAMSVIERSRKGVYYDKPQLGSGKENSLVRELSAKTLTLRD